MKIIQINAVNGRGSTGRTCMEFAEALNTSGHECYTFYSEGYPSEKAECLFPKWECKLHAILSRITGLQAYFSFIGTHRIIKRIKSINPDIVHIRNIHSNMIHLPKLLRFLEENDIPTVVTLDDCWHYTGKCTHYTTQKCYKWQQKCGDCPKLKTDNVSWFFDRTNKMLSDKRYYYGNISRLGVIGVSDWITEEAKKSVLKNAKIIRGIYNWIDVNVFVPVNSKYYKNELGLEGKFIILGVASGWSKKKGLHHFIKLASLLADDEHIVLVGDMPSIDLPSKITHIPKTENLEQLVELYSMADVFLQCSEEETFGKVVAEALSCGTPVITNDKTANPELVNDKCGIVIEEVCEDKIVNAIAKIRSSGKSSYSAMCREYALQMFNKEKLINETLDFYSELITTRK